MTDVARSHLPLNLRHLRWLALALVAALSGRAPLDVCGAAEVPGWEKIAWTEFDGATPALTADGFRRLFAPAPGAACDVLDRPRGAGLTSTVFRGAWRLAEPWRPGTVLRWALAEHQGLQFGFWKGQQGVLLVCRPGNRGAVSVGQQPPEPWYGWSEWAAYAVTRRGDSFRPERMALWATDEGRFVRSGSGTVCLYLADGELVLARGDLRLLSVPLAELPDDVSLEGMAVLLSLERLQAQGVPPDWTPPPKPVALRDAGALPWDIDISGEPDEGDLRRLQPGIEASIGRLARRGGKAAERRYSTDLAINGWPDVGLGEYVFQFEDPPPSSGLFLADDLGRPLCRLVVAGDRVSGRGAWGLARSDGRVDGRVASRGYQWERMIVPYAGAPQWLRVMMGAGGARCWVSGDGRHWSMIGEKPTPAGGVCRRVGLHVWPDQSAVRSIRLLRLGFRKLEQLPALVPPDVLARAVVFEQGHDLRRWQQEIARSRPDDVADDVWQRACAVRTVAETTNPNLGQALLWQLLEEAWRMPGDAAAKWALLSEALLLLDTSEPATSNRLAALYQQLGGAALARGEAAPFSPLVDRLLAAPLQPRGGPSPFPEALVRHELLRAVYEGRWPAVAELCRRLDFWGYNARSDWGRDQSPPLRDEVTGAMVRWAALEAAEETRAAAGKPEPTPSAKAGVEVRRDVRGRVRLRWEEPAPRAGHPLVEQLNREDFNTWAEFHAALAARSFAEACQLVQAPGATVRGLIPDPADRNLLTSLDAALAAALAAEPELRQAMQKSAALGELRLRQAIVADDPRAIAAVAARFAGTPAAAEARRWLGDRDLAAGRFAQALGHYRAAEELAPAAADARWQARRRLAGALAGKNELVPVTQAVELGGKRWEPAEFEALVAGLQAARRGGDALSRAADAGPTGSAFALRPWNPPAESVGANTEAGRFPLGDVAAARRLAALVEADGLVTVSLPTRLVAFQTTDGRVRWNQTSTPLPDRGDQAFVQAALAATPVVAGHRLIVRRTLPTQAGLICLDTLDGNLLWATGPALDVISDPLVVDAHVYAVGGSLPVGQSRFITLYRLDRESGDVLGQWPLVELRASDGPPLSCRMAVQGETLLATVGGCAICCELDGRVRWVRRQTLFVWPKTARPTLLLKELRPHDSPLVDGSRAWTVQPGVYCVECLDVATGRKIWSRPEPTLRRSWGLWNGRLVVETDEALVALEADTGKQLWQHPLPAPLGMLTADGPESLVYLAGADRQSLGRFGEPVARVVRLDLSTGEATVAPLSGVPRDAEMTFGPIAVTTNGQTRWATVTLGQQGGQFWEVVPAR